MQQFLRNRAYVSQIMKTQHIDVLVMPISTQGAATYNALTVNTARLPISSNSGLPAIVVPIDYTATKIPMPVGMEFIEKFNDELTLLQIANVLEQTLHRKTVSLEQHQPGEQQSRLNIAQYNNLLTLVGCKTYLDFLISHQPEQLSPERFTGILRDVVRRNR